MGSPYKKLTHLSAKSMLMICQLGDSSVRANNIKNLCAKLSMSDTTLSGGEAANLFKIDARRNYSKSRYGPFELSLTDKGHKHFHWSNAELGIQSRIISYLVECGEVSSEHASYDLGQALNLSMDQIKSPVVMLSNKGIVHTRNEVGSRGRYMASIAINEKFLKNQDKPRPKKMVLPAPSEPSPKPAEETKRGFMGVIEHLVEKEVQRRLEVELKQREDSDRDFIKDLLDDFANKGDIAPLKLLSDIHEYVSN